MQKHKDVVSLIGNTPLVRLNRASEMTGCEIWGKAEFLNPGQSVKDRAALYIVRDAETNELYILECHSQGNWLYTPLTESIQAASNIDFEKQFDAIEKAAQILVRETPRLAKTSLPIGDDRIAHFNLQGVELET